jgi:hypothetical protein
MSQRRDIDQLDMWAFAVAASRTARVRPPLALPFSNTWLVSGSHLADPERAALARAVRVNALIKDRRSADSAEYDPAARDTDFGLGAYAFAFWRLCRQPISTVDHIAARVGNVDRSGDRGGRRDEPGPAVPLDRVRVVQLRAPHRSDASCDGAAAHGPRYHHRWPVRMHKVRQYYPSLGSHKVIWRGPYIKGPDGAPLLIGPKAQAVTA